MKTELRVLLIEDSEIDQRLILRELTQGGFAVDSLRVETPEALTEALKAPPWDLVLCDHKLPQFDAPTALEMVKRAKLDVPFIVVSGNISTDLAVEMMRKGAHDYVIKGDLARFVPAVKRELLEAKRRRELTEAQHARDDARKALLSSEERYKEIFHTVSDLVISVDVAPGGSFLLAQWNETCSKLFHLKEADGTQHLLSETLPMAVLPEIEHLLRSCLSRGEPISADQSFELADGRREFSVSLHPIRDEGRRIRRIIVLARDITERKRSEDHLRRSHEELETRVRERTAELTKANARLRELDRLKSEFLATMSHELRTPLNSIIGFTGLVKEGIAGPVNEEQHKQLSMVYSASKHLLGLINDLLDVSRIEAGRISLISEPFDFAGVVAETVAQLKPVAAAKRLAIRPQLPAGALPLIGDRRRCVQVMLNLTHNAIKFTEKGAIDIIVRTESKNLRIDVIDTGQGIHPDLMDTVFEAFRQGDGSAKRTHEGTGLGLYLCRKLLDLMGGEISVHSVHGQGSRFTFTLPRHLPKEKLQSTPATTPPSRP